MKIISCYVTFGAISSGALFSWIVANQPNTNRNLLLAIGLVSFGALVGGIFGVLIKNTKL